MTHYKFASLSNASMPRLKLPRATRWGFLTSVFFRDVRGQLGRTCSTPTAHNGSFGVASVSQSLDIEAYGSVVVGWLSPSATISISFSQNI